MIPYYPKNFDTRIIPKHRTVRPRWFLAMWDKKLRQNCDTPIIQKIFDARKFLKHKGPPTKLFGTVRQKQPTKSWYTFLQKYSIPEHFWNTRVPLRKFLVLWDKKDWQNRVTPNTQKFFKTRTILTHRIVRPRCFSATWDKNFPTEKRAAPFLTIIFSLLETSSNTEGFAHDAFRRRETKKFRR